MKAFVEERVESGRYANASDFMRDLVRREMDERDRVFAELQMLVDEGIASGISKRTPEEVFAYARERAIAAAKRKEEAVHQKSVVANNR
jgi:antitoxin ParD1/3/4